MTHSSAVALLKLRQGKYGKLGRSVCVCAAACPLDNNLIVKWGQAIKSPLATPWCIWGSQTKCEPHRIHQPSFSSHFLSRATVRSLHDHKFILWFFLLHDSCFLSAFPQQPLKLQQPAHGLTVTSSLLPNHPIKELGCLIEWFSHYHLSIKT